MSKPVHGDPNVDIKLRDCMGHIESIYTPSNIRNLDKDTLTYLEDGFSQILENIVEFRGYREKQSEGGKIGASRRWSDPFEQMEEVEL